VHLLQAENALAQNQLPEKGLAIGHAVRIIEEGLRSGLDMRRGGELSQSLNDLYVYCAKTLTEANFYNDVSKVREVASLIDTVAGAWKQVAAGTSVQ
jgi:flagellar protein FliS